MEKKWCFVYFIADYGIRFPDVELRCRTSEPFVAFAEENFGAFWFYPVEKQKNKNTKKKKKGGLIMQSASGKVYMVFGNVN